MTAEISSLTPAIVVETKAARVSVLPPRGRLSLRARGDLTALSAATGYPLPERIGARAAKGGAEFIRLGPDEWTILLATEEVGALAAAYAAVYAEHPHSLVDISGREVTFLIEGPKAAELLTLGCPRDIEAIPAGEGRRAVFDGASVVLWRDAADRFRMDIWNSFATHLAHLLETGSKELAAEHA